MARELTPAATLAAYGAGLAVVFVAALGIGSAVGPVGDGAPDHGTSRDHGDGSHGTDQEHGSGDGPHPPSTDGEAR